MNQFPQMLYRADGPEEIHGGRFSTLIVQDADELEAALAGGWSTTTTEATEAAKDLVPRGGAGGTIPDDSAPPTRDELKQKANELGLTFPANIPTDKLAAQVEAALAGKE